MTLKESGNQIPHERFVSHRREQSQRLPASHKCLKSHHPPSDGDDQP
eukprot:CAMPEP_0201982908 /NCGR_PEP_ID=MMETSP0904-20121228/78484_1 /ASSEMBLY_ACC=CAM_ASM_000553 /TAXON_ID=420261 /ORGANISM="Thalassiosira antarctica, Strain CCMP982" /LENGTH=46 /DNA_ID= /DNA_START= /DNA_END= /DNA_ORIENTATION=